MAGSVSELSRETCRMQNGVHGHSGPKSHPAGVRAFVVAVKRLMSVEPRDAGRWTRENQSGGLKTGDSDGGNIA
jgi:hypothetical protein